MVVRVLSCAKCKQEKPETAFAVRSDRKRGRGSYCKECEKPRIRALQIASYDPTAAAQKNRLYQSENGDKVYFRKILKRFGVTRQQYEDMLVAQNGRCKVCKELDNRRLAVDHCHVTGEVRGLLCFHCNTVLGKVKDDSDLLRKLAEYLEGDR